MPTECKANPQIEASNKRIANIGGWVIAIVIIIVVCSPFVIGHFWPK